MGLQSVLQCVGFSWTGFETGRDYKSGFCGKMPEASPASERANASLAPGWTVIALCSYFKP